MRADEFDWQAYVRQRYPLDALSHSAARVRQTRRDPLLFGLTYFGHHLESEETGHVISFSDFHLDLCTYASTWMIKSPEPMANRHGWIAPRGSGKSSWLFLILPAWALAHGHRRYVAAFADTATQAETHLKSLKIELDTNPLLRYDFSDFCKPGLRPDGRTVADDESLTVRGNGAVFMAKGIDSSALGAKLGNQRPDCLLFDDIEPDEANYSVAQKEKRLKTIVQAVFPMNTSAVVTFAGTVTMPGSVIHDLVRSVTEAGPPEPWVTDEKIQVHHYPALATDADTGQQRSTWPARWSLEHLLSIQHTRSFAMNFQNEPINPDGLYWTVDDIRYWDETGESADYLTWTRKAMVIDPAVSDGKASDWSALAVGWLRPAGVSENGAGHPLVLVKDIRQVKATGRQLRDYALRLAEQLGVQRVFIECNQGHSLWLDTFADFPIRVDLMHASEPKPVRAGMALNHYQATPTRVIHERKFASAETQMLGFPKTVNDDQVDAVSHLTRVLLEPDTVTIVATVQARPRRPVVASVTPYA
jgi:GNAT superfamily N-acetyltransferase